jgi:hypothetical protein
MNQVSGTTKPMANIMTCADRRSTKCDFDPTTLGASHFDRELNGKPNPKDAEEPVLSL